VGLGPFGLLAPDANLGHESLGVDIKHVRGALALAVDLHVEFDLMGLVRSLAVPESAGAKAAAPAETHDVVTLVVVSVSVVVVAITVVMILVVGANEESL